MKKVDLVYPLCVMIVGLMIFKPALAQNQILTDLNSLTVQGEDRCSSYVRSHYSYSQSVEPKIVEAQGGMFSPYDFTCFANLRESDIEHITATSEAHDSGMCGRPRSEKSAYASDLLNLTLATPSLNRNQKSAKDAAEWVPEKNKCWFAATIVQTKKKYGLTVDQAEKTALLKLINDCISSSASFSMVIPQCGDQTTMPALTINDASANEGDALTFTMTLDNAISGGFTVTPSFTDGTALKGTDYAENTQAINFTGTANEMHTFLVSTIEDTSVESDETFTVGLTISGTSESITASDTGTGTIVNDDVAPVVSVTINNASASEGDPMTFTVTLDNAVSGGLTVTPRFDDGTALKGMDYTENTEELNFKGTANETQTFTVSTTEDALVEADETFTVGLIVDSETTDPITATDTGVGTIIDDDVPSVTINNASANEGNPMTFTVILDTAVSGGFTVTPSFTGGTANKGVDYTENTQAISFAGTANETHTFAVSTIEDTSVEADETFTVGLTVTRTTTSITSTDTGTGTIVDDDTAVMTINNASASEGDLMIFTITLDNAVSGGLTVTPSFTDGTAKKGIDYIESIQAVSFTGSANEAHTFAVSTIEDTAVEANETFTVGLIVSGSSESITATDTGTGSIIDDDVVPIPSVTINNASASEGDPMTFTVTLDNAVTGGFTITPSFTDGTAKKGDDYIENIQAISFTGSANEAHTFAVSTIEDTAVEANETFTVGLIVSGSSESITSTDTGIGTIIDDDVAPVPSVTINNASANEGDPLIFTATLDNAVTGGFTITPSFTDGTAKKGDDYIENIQAMTFTGTTNESHTFSVSTIEDTAVEANETFTVGLIASGTSESIAATDTGIGTIINDDVEIIPSLVNIYDASAREGDPLIFTITSDNAVAGGFTIIPSFTDGTAQKGDDYIETTKAITFIGTANETHTFSVSTIEDTAVEANETFTVEIASSHTGIVVARRDALGTIVNDDSATVSISVTPNPVAEGNSMTAKVRVSNSVFRQLTLPLIFTTKTAETADYEPIASITIPQNQITGSATIATMIDEDLDDEIFTITLGTLPLNIIQGDTTSIDVTILDQSMPTSVVSQMDHPKTIFALEQNYPNPFNPSTSIEFSLDEDQHVTLTVYNMLGQKVETLVDGVYSRGHHRVLFLASGLSNSKYFYVLQSDHDIAMKVMTLMK